MFRSRVYGLVALAWCDHGKPLWSRFRKYAPITIGLLGTTYCDESEKQKQYKGENGQSEKYAASWDGITMDRLEHEFLIRQATTINVNAATQLLTVTLVAIQDTSERLRESLSKEICLVQQALDWGEEGTPPHHWDQLVAVRGSLCDLNHNLRTLISYMDYAEKLATVAAEISYLSGNIAASDAICERIDHACRTVNIQKQLTHNMQQESLELQQQAIIASPGFKEKLDNSDKDSKQNEKKEKK